MTPEERNLVTELFDRLATLEDAQRDPEAEAAIKDGLRQAPNAVYALVQTALVQDEALKRADARIRELEAELGSPADPARAGGFLGSMREALTGRRAGSVPTVRPADAPMAAPPGYRSEPPPMAAAPVGLGGGSFLGTAAGAAAGVIGGSLLLDSIRGMMGHHHGLGGFGPAPASAATSDPGSPWGQATGGAGGGNLGREAGLDDIGRGSRDDAGASRSQGLLDSDRAGDDVHDDTQPADDDDVQDDGDFDDLDGGGGDFGGDGGEQ